MMNSILQFVYQAIAVEMLLALVIVPVGLAAMVATVLFWHPKVTELSHAQSADSGICFSDRGGFLGMADYERIIKNRINQQATTAHP
jgi:hypothetical protein